jgi:Rieske Fe-S protein
MDASQHDHGDEGKRDFLKFFLGGGIVAFAGAVLYPILSYLKPPKQAEVEVRSVKVGKVDAIAPDSYQIVKFGALPAILIRGKDGVFHSFIATCTHLDCTVQYRKDMGVMWCACHNGKFDLTGRNISGPPPRPLEELRVIVEGGEVLISKMT